MRITTDSTDPAVLEELGSRLRNARLRRNKSQADLAAEAGVGRVTVQRIEDGNSASLTNLIRVLRALDLLEGLQGLVPEASESPVDELQRRNQPRRRARAPRAEERSEPPAPWRWGDEDER